MLLYMLLNRLWAYAPDETGGGGADDSATASTDAAATTTDTSASDAAAGAKTDDAATAAKGADTGKTDDTPVVPDKSAKEIARLTRALAARQTEINALKSGGKSPDAKPAQKADSNTASTNAHPALQGFKVSEDEDGNAIVQKGGRWVYAEDVIDAWETKQTIAELKSDRESRQQADEQAQQQKLEAEYEASIRSTITDLRTKHIPGFDGEDADDMDAEIFNRTNSIVNAQIKNGVAVDDKVVLAAITQAIERTRSLYGRAAALQAKGNADYSAQHPTKPGGQAGHAAPKDHLALSRDERERASAAAVRAVEAARR